VAEGFTCAVDEDYHSACEGLDFYGEHESKRYCVLHFPGEEKKDEFKKVLERKLKKKDYNFSGTVFPEGTSDFEGFDFDADANFNGAIFRGVASFREAQFSGESTYFTSAQFSGAATDFREAQFSGEETDFTSAQFSGEETSFSGTQFSSEKSTYFSEAQFSSGLTDFSEAQFSGEEIDFYKAQLSGEQGIVFKSAKFSGESTSFMGTQFSSFLEIDFREAQFSSEQGTNFSDARFSDGLTDFSEAQFSGEETDFYKAQFSGELGTFFSQAQFSGELTTFIDTQFSGGATEFAGAEFGSTWTNFLQATFMGEVGFEAAAFRKEVEFWGTTANLIFGPRVWVRFYRARIDKPELLTFNTVLLHPGWFINTDMRKVVFTGVKWYGMPGGPEGTLDEEIAALAKRHVESPHSLLAQACRRLSANAEENREYPLANEFHYWSMDALRIGRWRYLGWLNRFIKKNWRRISARFGLIATLLWIWRIFRRKPLRHTMPSGFGLVPTFYWALNGYGVRAGRAFWVLVGIWAAFANFYVLLDPSEFKDFGQGIGYLWQAAVYSLLAMARLNPEPTPGEPGLFQFLVGLEGILGPLQIALLALAVRRKVMR